MNTDAWFANVFHVLLIFSIGLVDEFKGSTLLMTEQET